jgi:enoyl-CoA hydratase/carnithine racemase
MNSELLVEHDAFRVTSPAEHVLLITIVSRPMGCFTVAAREALTAFINKANEDREVRCIVLTGTGNAFSVGSNIKEFEATPAWIDGARLAETGLNEAIELGRVPVIAACNGFALGGGAVLALACDFRIAGRSAKFGAPEVKLGAMATATGTMRLPLLVGRGQAMKLMLTGEPVDAAEAYRIGIFEEVVDDDQLQTRALELARQIASVSPAAVAASKRAVSTSLREGYLAGLRCEEATTVPLGLSDDAIEGKAAFVEKRRPVFR